jgi:hypothetical protein
MDKDWGSLVKEGKSVADEHDHDSWRLGELASLVTTEYGKGKLEQYAKEIGQNSGTLKDYRTTVEKWPDRKAIRIAITVARVLNRHPDRFEIAKQNPNMTRLDAKSAMDKWKATQPKHVAKKAKKPEPYEGPADRRHIESEIEQRVTDRVEDWMNKFRPHLDDAKAIKAGRRGIISKEDGTTLRRCLHPDNSASAEMRAKAFIIWQRIEHLLMSEQDAPTVVSFPRRKKSA